MLMLMLMLMCLSSCSLVALYHCQLLFPLVRIFYFLLGHHFLYLCFASVQLPESYARGGKK